MKSTYDEIYKIVEDHLYQKAFDKIAERIVAKGYATDAELDESEGASVVGKYSAEAADQWCKQFTEIICTLLHSADGESAPKAGYYENAAENYRQREASVK